MSNFWAVVKDPGGTSAVLPIVLDLRKKGHEVTLIVDGWAIDNLNESHGQIVCESAAEAIDKHTLPDILITCMSSKGGIGRDLVHPLKKRGVITVAIQDYWGARMWEKNAWAQLKHRPDYIIVNDQIGFDMVLQAWPEFREDRIIKLGYAALDEYAGIDVSKVANIGRKKLNISSDDKRPVILYGGQLQAAGKSLLDLVNCLNATNKEVILIARPHQRMPTDAPDEFELWNEALERFNCGMLITDSSACKPKEVIAAADLVTAMWSTMLGEAACLRKPVISLLLEGEGSGMEAFLASGKGGRTTVPVFDLGCCKSANTEEELKTLLSQFLKTDDLGLRPRQEEVFRLDGNNAERIRQCLLGLV